MRFAMSDFPETDYVVITAGGFDRPQAGLRVGRVAAELYLFTEVMSYKVRGNFGIGSGSKYVTDFL